jgi:hypothetical protein
VFTTNADHNWTEFVPTGLLCPVDGRPDGISCLIDVADNSPLEAVAFGPTGTDDINGTSGGVMRHDDNADLRCANVQSGMNRLFTHAEAP